LLLRKGGRHGRTAFPVAPDLAYSVIRYFENPSAPSPTGSIFTLFTSAMKSYALGPVSKITDVPSIGANDQLASADGLIVPCSTM